MNLNHAFISRIWKKQTGAWDMSENGKIYNAMKTVSFSLQSMKKFISWSRTRNEANLGEVSVKIIFLQTILCSKNTVGS